MGQVGMLHVVPVHPSLHRHMKFVLASHVPLLLHVAA